MNETVNEIVEIRPVYKKKHVYKDGSPGFNRGLAEVTLTHIKKEIAANSKNRRKYREDNLIA